MRLFVWLFFVVFCFYFYICRHSQVEITQYYVVAFSENESGSIVLYLSEFRKKIYRTARKRRVAMI